MDICSKSVSRKRASERLSPVLGSFLEYWWWAGSSITRTTSSSAAQPSISRDRYGPASRRPAARLRVGWSFVPASSGLPPRRMAG
jgi:hypothetical protein